MTTKTDDSTLKAVTQRVVDNFTAQGALFTALDVSNAVKTTLPDVRHRQVSPIVRDLFERHAMGDYQHSLIDVLADGKTPTQAYLYHLPEHSPALYDDSMRNQLAIPPVSTSTSKNEDASITAHSVEAPVPVGRDGRARVARQILMNAGIVGDLLYASVDTESGKILLVEAEQTPEDDELGNTIEYEHPSLLHVPRALVSAVFSHGDKLVAKVYSGRVEIVRH
ncbi:MAG: hypothetical protein U0326_23495 [Polyangiales bacterium]